MSGVNEENKGLTGAKESKIQEDKEERPPSPVLSNNKLHRKMIFRRRSGGVKGKVHEQNTHSQNAKDRFDKITKLETARKKFAESLYQMQNQTNYSNFHFKKPELPVAHTPAPVQAISPPEQLLFDDSISDTQINYVADKVISSIDQLLKDDPDSSVPSTLASLECKVLLLEFLQDNQSTEDCCGFEVNEQEVEFYKQFKSYTKTEIEKIGTLLNKLDVCCGFLACNKDPMKEYTKLIRLLEERIEKAMADKGKEINKNFFTDNGIDCENTNEEDAVQCFRDDFVTEEFSKEFSQDLEKGNHDKKIENQFSTASGKCIKVSQNALKKSIFTEEDLALSDSLVSDKSKKLTESEQKLIEKAFNEEFPLEDNCSINTKEEIEEIFKNDDFHLNESTSLSNVQFATASGKSISLSQEALKNSIFTEKDLELTDQIAIAKQKKQEKMLVENCSSQTQFSTASGKSISLSQEALKSNFFTAKDFALTDSIDFQKTGTKTVKGAQFSTASGKTVSPSQEALKNSIFTRKDLELTNQISFAKHKTKDEKMQIEDCSSQAQFSTASGKSISLSQEALKRNFFTANDLMLTDKIDFKKNQAINLADFFTATEDSIFTTDDCLEFRKPSPKTCTTSTPIKTIGSRALKMNNSPIAKSPIEFSTPEYRKIEKENSNSGPINLRKRCRTDESSTTPNCKRKLGCSPRVEKTIDIEPTNLERAKALFEEEGKEYRILEHDPFSVLILNEQMKQDKIERNKTKVKEESKVFPNENLPIILVESKEISTDKHQRNLTELIANLQEKLAVLLARKEALSKQQSLIKNSNLDHRSRRNGVLYQKKMNGGNIKLNKLKDFVNSQVLATACEFLEGISANNALNVHFNYQRLSTNNNHYLTTNDGAIVVPNQSNLIGLSEIKNGFLSMPGIDPNLLHHDWISNHFQWIVWKLASTERQYPNVFIDCLSVENVIQQLKYRYDREIDRAERSAIRKITEKDDAPQKRIILCVADIFKIADCKYELLLTDGWYGIKTIIDNQLSKQIFKKINVGTKLIIQCAELLNCDGYHPLDLTDLSRLKINYNCTRRTVWYAKLGYQRLTEPFPISLNSIHPDGGCVGRIIVYIARIYPLKYREQQVWRNKKAEDRRADEYEREQSKKIYTKTPSKSHHSKFDLKDIPNIQSAEVLYDLLENSNDPESIQALLSPEQLNSLIDYKVLNSNRNQAIKPRDVAVVLRFLLLDINYKEKHAIMNIWKPSNETLDILKEGSVYSIYNISARFNGELICTARTKFIEEKSLSLDDKYKRCYTSISEIIQNPEGILFHECDTVGILISLVREDGFQEIWLADADKGLLCVQFLEGPSRCYIDSFAQGDVIALSNLIIKNTNEKFGRAIGNTAAIISAYPKSALLQDAINRYKSNLPRNLQEFLNDCKQRMNSFKNKTRTNESRGDATTLSSATLADIENAMMDSDDW